MATQYIGRCPATSTQGMRVRLTPCQASKKRELKAWWQRAVREMEAAGSTQSLHGALLRGAAGRRHPC